MLWQCWDTVWCLSMTIVLPRKWQPWLRRQGGFCWCVIFWNSSLGPPTIAFPSKLGCVCLCPTLLGHAGGLFYNAKEAIQNYDHTGRELAIHVRISQYQIKWKYNLSVVKVLLTWLMVWTIAVHPISSAVYCFILTSEEFDLQFRL